MKLIFSIVTALALCASALAQNGQINANAKATLQGSALAATPVWSASTGTAGSIESPWTTVLAQDLKTAQNWDLEGIFYAVIGLGTETTVSSKNMVSDTATATAGVNVRMLIDGVVAFPGPVTYSLRSQQLTATLEGAIGGCLTNTVTTNLNGQIVVVTSVNTNCVLPEVIGLIQHTMSAHAFSFVAPAVWSGVHNVQIQVQVSAIGDNQNGTFKAAAFVGKSMLSISSSRLHQGGTPWELGQ